MVAGDWKYLIKGNSTDDREVVVVTKLGATGKTVIITVYVDE